MIYANDKKQKTGRDCAVIAPG